MPSAHLNGIDIHYRIDGTEGAPHLLFSNSLGTNLGMWDRQVEELAPHYRILRYDSRGHGRSGAPDAAYTIAELGRDAVALLDHLEIDRADYCGLSKGGMVGQWLGINAPERVNRLVLSNTSSFMSPKDLWNGRIKMVREKGMEAITEAVIERWFTQAFRQSGSPEIGRIRDMLHATPAQGYAACCAAIRDMDHRNDLARISADTLVIVGDADPATPPDHGELIAERVPGGRLCIIENAAHLANIEQPEAYRRALAGFLLT